MKKIFISFALTFSLCLSAQTELVFVFFKDKPNKAAFYANPLSELSQKSLDRRTKQGIALDDRDAPIEESYIQNIRNLGFTVTDYSKWLNGAAVNADKTQITLLQSQSYVQSVESFIKHSSGGKLTDKKVNKFDEFNNTFGKTDFDYGSGAAQIDQINLRQLHVAGFTGTGITIAVIDTGFPTVNTGSAYARLRNNGQIKGGYNFISKNNDIYNPSLNAHGSYCLGVIGGYISNTFVGAAPDADFYLYASEDGTREVPEELIYWTEAAEEADRKGADIITTSLGYYDFDDSRYNLLYSDMNGTTSFIARAAQIAAEKGIFVLSAAGNEALKPWHYIVTPADNAKVFSVGAVTADGSSSSFSSYGPNSVGVIKPDGSTRGTATALVYNNSATYSNGTSFATPLAAGGVACLLQAVQNKPMDEIKNQLRQTASLYPNYTNQMGYGILNFGKTYTNLLSVSDIPAKNNLKIYPVPAKNVLNISTDEKITSIEIYDALGKMLERKPQKNFSVEHLAKGIYYLKISTEKNSYVEKFVKE